MKQQSLWEPIDGADMRACWRTLPEASRTEIIEHLARLVVRAQLGSPKRSASSGASELIEQSTVANGDRRV